MPGGETLIVQSNPKFAAPRIDATAGIKVSGDVIATNAVRRLDVAAERTTVLPNQAWETSCPFLVTTDLFVAGT